jgi:hypothetical protein
MTAILRIEDLEFDAAGAANAFLTKLRRLWDRVDVVRDSHAQVVELVENEALVPERASAYD